MKHIVAYQCGVLCIIRTGNVFHIYFPRGCVRRTKGRPLPTTTSLLTFGTLDPWSSASKQVYTRTSLDKGCPASTIEWTSNNLGVNTPACHGDTLPRCLLLQLPSLILIQCPHPNAHTLSWSRLEHLVTGSGHDPALRFHSGTAPHKAGRGLGAK